MVWVILTLTLSQAELPPEARFAPRAETPAPSVVSRSLLATGGGALAGWGSLGLVMLVVGSNPNLDATFANAAFASIAIAGVAFATHNTLGGQGEVVFSFLLSAAVMAGAAGLAIAIDGHRGLTPLLTTAIGAIPAAAAAVFGLEVSSPRPKGVRLAFAPSGFQGMF